MKLKAILPHVGVIAVFYLVVFAYFSPVFQGKVINQSDIALGRGVTQEIRDYREANGEEPLWTNSMFGGQPTFFVSTLYPYDLRNAFKVISLGIPPRVSPVFISFLCFYFLLLVMRVDWRIAALGALAYGLSTYTFLLMEAGHNSKAMAMAFTPGLLGALIMAFKNNLKIGMLLIALFSYLEIKAYHPQITYYLLFIIGIYVCYETILAYKEGTIKSFLRTLVLVAAAGFIGVGGNANRLWTSYEYSKHTIRGKSELSAKQNSGENDGLSIDYATAWSYGKMETFTAIVPNIYGGGSNTELGKDSKLAKKLRGVPNASQILKNAPTYWGDQPFTSGPVYFGAIAVFLFILGVFVAEKRMLWWLIPAVVLSVLLSWGRNFMWLTELFYHYFPLYNKFRTVSMILVNVQLLVPFLGFYALHKLLKIENKKEALARLKKAAIAVGSVLGVVFVASWFMDFSGAQDASLASRGWPVDAIVADRKAMFKADLIRSFFLILGSLAVIWLLIKEKLTKNIGLSVLGILVLIDLLGVNLRYLNKEDFVSANKMEVPFNPTPADLQILQDPDPHYRVFNQSERIDASARTSFFHKSLGGYTAAKLGRYQELIDAHISRGNSSVINMLNAKYVLRAGANGELQAIRNPQALGNAWLVKQVQEVANADEELMALSEFNPASEAIIDQRFTNGLSKSYSGEGTIKLTQYDPKEMKYSYSATDKQLAVFSEIYYPDGWKVILDDGKELDIIRANYVLRAVELPAGSHKLTFKFAPKSYYAGAYIDLTCLIILGLLLIYTVWTEYQNYRKRLEIRD